jgi:hypothetical protein
MQMRPPIPVRLHAAASLVLLAALAGCGMNNVGSQALLAPTANTGVTALGGVHGGQQPVTGATIQLWEAGGTYSGSTGGYGSAAKNILTATVTSSDGSGSGGNVGNGNNSLPVGSFTLSPNNIKLYACDAPATGITSPYLYITASGGNPGSGNNSAITLMAALGPCSAQSTSTYIFIDEVTTIAAAYALAQFAATPSGTALAGAAVGHPGTSQIDAFGAPSTNLVGLVNAFNTAQVLASTTTGTANSTMLTPNLYGNTAATTANVEFWQINLLADILAACVNGNATQCTGSGSLTALATPSGATLAGDTLQAAVYMAQNPAGGPGAPASYAFNLANLITPTAPFLPYSTIAAATSTSAMTPTDLTIGVTYTSASFSQTSGIAQDSNGNVWLTNAGTSPSVVELDPVGNLIGTPVTSYLVGSTPTIFQGNGKQTGYQLGIALDTNNNAWVADLTSSNVLEVPGSGTLTPGSTVGSSNNGANVSGGTGAVGFATGVASAQPAQVAVDGSNDVWFTQNGGSGGSCGTAGSKQIGGFLAGAYGTYIAGAGASSNPYGLAIDGGGSSYDVTSGNTSIAGAPFIWGVDEAGGTDATPFSSSNGHFGALVMAYTGSGGATTQGCQTPLSLISSADTSSGVATKLNVTTGTINGTSDMFSWGANPFGIAVDNGGNLWIPNQSPIDVSLYVTNSVSKITPNLKAETAPLTSAQAIADFTYLNFPASFSPSLNMTSGGAQTLSTYAAGGLTAGSQSFNPKYVAIDGAGNAWISGTPGSSNNFTPAFAVVALTNAGLALSPSTTALNTTPSSTALGNTLGVAGFIGGFINSSATPVASGGSYRRILQGGTGIAIDRSGNVWIANNVATVSGGSSQPVTGGAVTELVGSAVPVVTPLALGVKNGTLGSRP